MNISSFVQRDQNNAIFVANNINEEIDDTSIPAEITSLKIISKRPFTAMIDIEWEIENRTIFKDCFYVHEDIHTSVKIGKIRVLTWTHPFVQIGLNFKRDEFHEVAGSNYNIRKIKPLVRAKFEEILPEIVGYYEPGGRIASKKENNGTSKNSESDTKKLKSVKLEMTSEQVKAFISKINGMIIITGSPGSGKTTVAMQRIRFLFDFPDFSETISNYKNNQSVNYSQENTKIFIANDNLISYTNTLINNELGLSENILVKVDTFINNLMNQIWEYRFKAELLSLQKYTIIEQKAIESIFSRCTVDDLKKLWRSYQNNFKEKIYHVYDSDWFYLASNYTPKENKADKYLFKELAEKLKNINLPVTESPLISYIGIDNIYNEVKSLYTTILNTIKDKKFIAEFCELFNNWLFAIYDPLSIIKKYLTDNKLILSHFIDNNMNREVDSISLLEDLIKNLDKRIFTTYDVPVIAWLLRFILPADKSRTFQNISIGIEDIKINHIVMDEVQDFSVFEASLITSLINPDGAITISADMNQSVSNVHGLNDFAAIKICNPLSSKDSELIFKFAVNMRQTYEISRFLMDFYLHNFNKPADFKGCDTNHGDIPRIEICENNNLINKLTNIIKITKKKYKSIAVLQINEDIGRLNLLRVKLISSGVDVEELFSGQSETDKVVISSVEKIKGLEYDCCIIVDMDKAIQSRLPFTKERSYVAISRARLKLFIVCEVFPEILRKIDNKLYDKQG